MKPVFLSSLFLLFLSLFSQKKIFLIFSTKPSLQKNKFLKNEFSKNKFSIVASEAPLYYVVIDSQGNMSAHEGLLPNEEGVFDYITVHQSAAFNGTMELHGTFAIEGTLVVHEAQTKKGGEVVVTIGSGEYTIGGTNHVVHPGTQNMFACNLPLQITPRGELATENEQKKEITNVHPLSIPLNDFISLAPQEVLEQQQSDRLRGDNAWRKNWCLLGEALLNNKTFSSLVIYDAEENPCAINEHLLLMAMLEKLIFCCQWIQDHGEVSRCSDQRECH